MSIYQPYLYLIGWPNLDKWYLGIQYGKNSHPSNLWTTYFTSSDYVKQFREENGEPDIIITIPAPTAEIAISKEKQLLRECDLHSGRWLNKNIAGNIIYTDDVRKKISDAASSRGQYYRQKLSKAHQGKSHSSETRKKLSIAASARPQVIRNQVSQSLSGRIISDDTRLKMSKSKTGLTHRSITCPHCQKTGGENAMRRYHFDNCKLKGDC